MSVLSQKKKKKNTKDKKKIDFSAHLILFWPGFDSVNARYDICTDINKESRVDVLSVKTGEIVAPCNRNLVSLLVSS